MARVLFYLLLCLLAGPSPAQNRKTAPKPKPPASPSAPAKPGALPAPKVEWRPVYYKGRAYVPANQVAAYYDLRVPEVWQKSFTIRSSDAKFTIELTVNEKRVKLSGWTFYFSFPVVQPKDMPMISVFDVRNVLDPILRPNDRRDPAILRTVVIDPSCGGNDTGIKSPYIAEKDLTLAVAQLLAPLLKANGYQVVLTREEDKSLLPGFRVLEANDVRDEAIYLNLRAASGPAALRGFECSTLPPAGTPATVETDSPNIDKRFFAGNINDRESLALATTIQNSVVRQARALDLGIRRTRVEELRDVRMPAISCKLGYLSHKEEAKKLATREYQAELAIAIVQGVDRYATFLRTGYEIRTEEDRKRPLSFGPVSVKQEPAVIPPGAEKIALRLPIIASGSALPSSATVAAGAAIDRSKMELQVFLFESVNGGEIDLSTANPPEVNWLSVLPDWLAGVPEWLQVSYLRPPFSIPETKAYGNRSYYGYVARLIYDGRLLDEASFPANLNRALYYFTPVFPEALGLPAMKSPLIWILGFLICIGLGILLLTIYWSIRSVQASRWPSAAAHLLTAELKSQSGSKGGITYRVLVRYEYSVNGIIYSGDRVAFGYLGTGSRGVHRSILNKLKSAQDLQVRYSSSDPSVSTLSAGFHEFHKRGFAFAAMWLSIIILTASIAWRFTKPEETVRQNLITR